MAAHVVTLYGEQGITPLLTAIGEGDESSPELVKSLEQLGRRVEGVSDELIALLLARVPRIENLLEHEDPEIATKAASEGNRDPDG